MGIRRIVSQFSLTAILTILCAGPLNAQMPGESRGFSGDGLHLYPLGWSADGRWGALIGRTAGEEKGIRLVVIDMVSDEVLFRSETMQWSGPAEMEGFWSNQGGRILSLAAPFRLDTVRRTDVRDSRFTTGGVNYDFLLDPPSPAAGAYVLRIRSSRGDFKDVYRSSAAGAPAKTVLMGAIVSPFEERALAVLRETGTNGQTGYRFSGAHLTQGFRTGTTVPDGPADVPAAGAGGVLSAVFNGQEYLLRARLSAGADPDERDERGYPAVLVAARLGHWTMVGLLLDAGAKPGEADSSGRTALHYAAFAGNDAAVAALLSAGADRNHTDGAGLTAADLAADATLRSKLR